jgi:hypothetical protein
MLPDSTSTTSAMSNLAAILATSSLSAPARFLAQIERELKQFPRG